MPPFLSFTITSLTRCLLLSPLLCRDKAVRRTAEWRGLKQDLTWWATERPVVVVAFIRGTHEAIAGATQRGLSDTAWRRSAVAFLQDLGLLAGAHASVVNRIDAEAALLDRAFSSSGEFGGMARGPARSGGTQEAEAPPVEHAQQCLCVCWYGCG
jgi:hypothetical protein